MLCKLYNKGVCRYQNQTERVDKGVTYQHFCSNCLASTGKKYEHPKQQFLRLKNEKRKAQIHRRFDCGSNSSYNAYLTAKNGTARTNTPFLICKSDGNIEIQAYCNLNSSVTIERESGFESASLSSTNVNRMYKNMNVTVNRVHNTGSGRHCSNTQYGGDYTRNSTDHEIFLENYDLNKLKEFKQSGNMNTHIGN